MAADSPVTFRPEIFGDGRSLSEEAHDALVSMRVAHGLGVPAYVRLSFRVGDPDVVDGILPYDGITTEIGDEVKVTVDNGDGDTWTVFDGLAVSVGVDVETSFSQYVIIEAYDKLYRLGRKLGPATFVDMSAKDIIRKLADEGGLTVGTIDLSLSSTRESTYQNTTAYELIDRLAREAGCEWFVNDGKLDVRPRPKTGTKHTLTNGDNLLRFSARYSASEQVDKVEVTGWDVHAKKAIVGEAKFSAPSNNLKSKPAGKNVGGTIAMSIPRPVASVNDAKMLAEGLMRRRESEMLRARGEAEPDAAIVPGATLTIEDVGPQWSGDYYCTGVEHTFDSHGFRTEFEVGPSEPESLVDLFGGGPSQSLASMLGSLTIGIVTNNEDDEKLNRVKLKLPYLSDEEETGWARVLQPGSGKDRGWNVLPEVNDEVLVGFEHGDIDRPLVLGGLINGKDRPKYSHTDTLKDGKVGARIFNSRLGHELRFSDGAGKPDQFVKINTVGNEATLLLGVEGIELQAADIPVKVYNKEGSIEVAENGDITIEGNNITIKAKQDIKVEGNNIKAKAKMNADLEAGAQLGLKGASQAKLESSGPAMVKGTIVNIN